MQNEIRWLVRLGLDQGLFTREHARAVLVVLGPQANLMDFAQQLIDDAYVADDHLALLEKVAGLAQSKGKAGPPADDPFDHETFSAPAPASAPALRADADADATAPSFMTAPRNDGPAKAPTLPFAALGAMDDTALADACAGSCGTAPGTVRATCTSPRAPAPSSAATVGSRP